MNDDVIQLLMLDGLLADEISAIIQYVASAEPGENNKHPELHKAILEMHNNPPTQLQHRIAIAENQSDVSSVMSSK